MNFIIFIIILFIVSIAVSFLFNARKKKATEKFREKHPGIIKKQEDERFF